MKAVIDKSSDVIGKAMAVWDDWGYLLIVGVALIFIVVMAFIWLKGV